MTESQNRERAAPFENNRRYFLRPNGVGRWKAQLTIAVAVAVLAWVAVSLAIPSRLHRDVSRGPVARVHSAWNDRCKTCHVPFAAGSRPLNPLDVHERWHAFRCESCHAGPVDDPKNYAPHHGSATWTDRRPDDCADCHREHQGEAFALARAPDSDCLRCHTDLPNHVVQPDALSANRQKSIRTFAETDSHPDFAVLSAPYRRTLKFSHAVHLAPELKPHRLECAGCHQLDGGRTTEAPRLAALPSEAIFPPRAAGAYFLPIVYEKHCQECHDLKITPLQSKNGVAIAGFSVPHRLPPAELAVFMRAELARQVAALKPDLLKVPLPPSDRLELPRVNPPSDLTKELDDLTTKAERLLFDLPFPATPRVPTGRYCLKCHDPEPAGPLTSPPATLTRTRIPTVWLEHAKFNHASHGALKCAACHDKKADPDEKDIVERELLGLPNVDKCRQCHSPTRLEGDKPRGGVRHNCVDCHRYHNGDRPLEGTGALRRNVPLDRKLTIDAFLKGSPE